MPESLYALPTLPKADEPYGYSADGLNQVKDLVKQLHKEGISVIVDVVYNHASQYDQNPLKFLDRDYYFRHESDGSYSSHSGCGT